MNTHSRIVGSPAPTDGQIERLSDHLDHPICTNRARGAHLRVQLVYIGRLDGTDLHRANARKDELLPHAPVVGSRSPYLAGQVLCGISIEEILHRWRGSRCLRRSGLRLRFLKRIYVHFDLPSQLFCFFSCGGCRSSRKTADGHSSLAPVDDVIEDERPNVLRRNTSYRSPADRHRR
jgi:hypothetical protein